MVLKANIVTQVKDMMRRDWERGQDLRALAIETLLEEYEGASDKYKRFITNQLDQLGHDRDSSPMDSGNGYDPKE